MAMAPSVTQLGETLQVDFGSGAAWLGRIKFLNPDSESQEVSIDAGSLVLPPAWAKAEFDALAWDQLVGAGLRVDPFEGLLFDRDGDGAVDGFYLPPVRLELDALNVQNWLWMDGVELRLGASYWLDSDRQNFDRFAVVLLARRARLGVRDDGFGLRLEAVPSALSPEGPAIRLDWSLDAIELDPAQLVLSLEYGGSSWLRLVADDVGPVVTARNGGVGGGDELWFELSGLRGELGVLAGERGAAEVDVERVGVQVDGDVEVGVMGMKVPGGFGSEWLGMLPVVLEEGELSFGERVDGSADWSEPQAVLRGVVRLGGLREGLRKGLEQEGLDVQWWSDGGGDGVWVERKEGDVVEVEVGVQGEGALLAGGLGVVNGEAQRIVLSGVRLPLPGGEVLLRGELLLAGVDEEGRWKEVGAGLLPEGEVVRGAQAVLVLEGMGEGGGEVLRGRGGGRALLSGAVESDGTGGMVLRLGGEVEVRDVGVDLAGLGVEVSGGYGRVELGWDVGVRGGEWSGIPVVKGVSAGELAVEVSDVLRVEIGEVNWYGTARSVVIDGVSVDGLVGRASGVKLLFDADLLRGIGVNGLDVSSTGEGVLLFDEDSDGGVDSFYLDGALVSVGDVVIGEGWLAGGEGLLALEGAQLVVRDLTTVSALLAEGEVLAGELRLQARSGRLGAGSGVELAVGESRVLGGDVWGIEGVIDVSEQELRLGLERVDVLVGDGGEVLSVGADPAGEKDALELRIDLNGGVGGGDELWFELSGLRGELGVLAGERGAAEVDVERVGVQVDGDVEVGVMGMKVPGGFGSEWLGMLPVVLEEGELSFGERVDGSADWSEPQAVLRGVVRLGGLREGLRKGLEQEGLDVQWWSDGGGDGVWVERKEGDVVEVEVGVQGEGALLAGGLGVVNGEAQRIVLSGVRLPLPGGEVLLRGELLLAGVDEEGRWKEVGAGLLPEGEVVRGAQAVLVLEGMGEGGGEVLRGRGGGRALLSGAVESDGTGGMVLRLGGEVEVRDVGVDLAGLGVEVSGGYGRVELGWDVGVRGGEWSGIPVVKGVSAGELAVEVSDVLRVEIGEVNWYGTARSVVIDGVSVDGLVGRARDAELLFTGGFLEGLSLVLPAGSNGLMVFDVDQNGVPDSFYIDQLRLPLGSLEFGGLAVYGAEISISDLTNVPALVDADRGFYFDGDILIGATSIELSMESLSEDFRLDFMPGSDGYGLIASISLADGSLSARAEHMHLRASQITVDGLARFDASLTETGFSSEIEAFGWLDPGLDILPELRAGLKAKLTEQGVEQIWALVGASVAPKELGGLLIEGDLAFALNLREHEAVLQALVTAFEAELNASVSYDIDGKGFTALLTLSGEHSLALADWLSVSAATIKYAYGGPDQGSHSLEIAGEFQLKIGESLIALTGVAEGSLDLSAGGLSLKDFSLDRLFLEIGEGTVLQFGDLAVRVERDAFGLLPSLSISVGATGIYPALSSGRFVVDSGPLAGFALGLPADSMRYEEGVWKLNDFRVDLNQSNDSLDFGIARLGSNAEIWFDSSQQSLFIRPDLELNPYLYNLSLLPFGIASKYTVLPAMESIEAVMTASLLSRQANSSKVDIFGARVDIGPFANDISSFISALENTPYNPFKGDGRLYLVELLDFLVWEVYSVVKENPQLPAATIAAGFNALGIPVPQEAIEAIIFGLPYLSIGAGISTLSVTASLLRQLVPSDQQISSAITRFASDPQSFILGDQAWVDTEDFTLQLQGDALTVASLSGQVLSGQQIGEQLRQSFLNRLSRGDLQAADLPGLKAFGSLVSRAPLTPLSYFYQQELAWLLEGFDPFAVVSAELSMPLFDDIVEGITALVAGQNIELIELDFDASAGLSWEIREAPPNSYISALRMLNGLWLPGQSGKVDINLDSGFTLGLVTNSERLTNLVQQLSLDLQSDMQFADLLALFSDLLQTEDSEAGRSGLYLQGHGDSPLLELTATARLYQQLIDFGFTGLRGYTFLTLCS